MTVNYFKNRVLSESMRNSTVRIPQNLVRLEQGEHFILNVNDFIVIKVGLTVLMDSIMNFK